MKKITLLIGILCMSTALFAQSAYKKGFVVTNQGDTIRGEVYTDMFAATNKLCKLKIGESIKKYTPNDILEYTIEGERTLVSGIVPDMFIEVLVKGDVSLYTNTKHYYLKKDGRVHEIVRNKTIMKEGSRVSVENKMWRGKVFALIKDKMREQLNPTHLRYNEKYLTRLIQKYNGDTNQRVVRNTKNKEKAKLKFGLLAGVNFETFNISVVNTLGIKQYSSKNTGNTPFFGAMLNLRDPRWSERLNLQLEFLFSKMTIEPSDWNVSLSEYQNSLEYTKLSIPASLKYTFPMGKFATSLQVGALLDLNLNGKCTIHVNNNNYASLDPVQMGAFAGMEISRKIKNHQLGLSVRYYAMSKMIDEGEIDIVKAEDKSIIGTDQVDLKENRVAVSVYFTF